MIKEAIAELVAGRNLPLETAALAMTELMSGQTSPAQTAAFITALAIKGETIDEITACAKVMRAKAAVVHAQEPFVDIVGTGGDKSGTFNISTAAALVTAGSGLRVAKHGNRAASSHSGSADLLAELGVNLDADIPTVERCIAEANIGFMFAPKMHAAMKHAIGPRREIGIRTVFNILGPLTNPAGARDMLLGVFSADIAVPMAKVLAQLGARHVYVVRGEDGLDEVTITDRTLVAELKNGTVSRYHIQPEDFGIQRTTSEQLRVDSVAESAEHVRSVLAGRPGPVRDIVVLNAACGIAAGGAAPDIAAGVEVAQNSIDSGAAADALEKLVRISHAD